MAETASRNDPFFAFRFEIRIDDLAVGGFSECTGLAIETEVHDYQEGGRNDVYLKFPTRTKQTNITLKRGIVDREMWGWYDDLIQGRVQYRNGSIFVYEPTGGGPVIEWQFRRALPVKWQGPDLNATQNSVAVETVELAHQGLIRRR